MKLIITAVSAFLMMTSAAKAANEGPCANFAKSGAIRAYKAETGTIQGSNGIEYSAKLIGTRGDISDYLVTIADNNEDGESWEVDYAVKVKGSNSSCKILAVKKIGAR